MYNTGINKLLNNFEEYYNNEDYENAKKVSTQIVEYYKRNNLQNSKNYACHLFNQSLVFYYCGELSSAIKVCKKAYNILLNLKDSLLLACAANNLGVYYSSAGNCTSASAYFKKAYNIRVKLLDYNNITLADTVSNLGSVNYDMKRYEQALAYHKDALDRLEKNSESYVTCLSHIAYDYEKLKNYPAAIRYLKNAAELMPQTDSSDYIAALFSLAGIYVNNKEYENALAAYERVLFLAQKAGLANEPFYGEAVNKTADVYYSVSNYKKALELRLKALDIFEKQVGTENMLYANCLKEVAKIYRKNYVYGKAIAYLKQSLKVKGVLLTPDDKDYIDDTFLLSDMYEDNGETEKSNNILEYLAANISAKNPAYTKILLVLINRYRAANNIQKLYSVYDKYKQTDPTITFDELLLLAEAAKHYDI